MIIREWRGRASWACADAYPLHFRGAVLPALRRTPGFLGACLSRRCLADRVEFLVLTRWQSLDAIRTFTAMTSTRPSSSLLASLRCSTTTERCSTMKRSRRAKIDHASAGTAFHVTYALVLRGQ